MLIRNVQGIKQTPCTSFLAIPRIYTSRISYHTSYLKIFVSHNFIIIHIPYFTACHIFYNSYYITYCISPLIASQNIYLFSPYLVYHHISYLTIFRILRYLLTRYFIYIHISYCTASHILGHLVLHHIAYLTTYPISPYISYLTSNRISPHLVSHHISYLTISFISPFHIYPHLVLHWISYIKTSPITPHSVSNHISYLTIYILSHLTSYIS